MTRCSYPLTGKAVVRRIYSNLAVIEVGDPGFIVKELAAGVSLERLQELTDAPLHVHVSEPPREILL